MQSLRSPHFLRFFFYCLRMKLYWNAITLLCLYRVFRSLLLLLLVFGRKTKSSAAQQTPSAPEGLTGNWEGLAARSTVAAQEAKSSFLLPLLPSLSPSLPLSLLQQAAFSSAYVSAILRGLKMICWSLCEHSINSWFLRAQCRRRFRPATSLSLSFSISISLSLAALERMRNESII